MLLSIGHSLRGHKVQWHTDNQNIVRVIDRGSTKPDLQSLVEDIVYLCAENHVVVVPVWVPREQNQLADYLSKLTDVDDWGINPDIFWWISTGALLRLTGSQLGITPNVLDLIPASGIPAARAWTLSPKIGSGKTTGWYPHQAR